MRRWRDEFIHGIAVVHGEYGLVDKELHVFLEAVLEFFVSVDLRRTEAYLASAEHAVVCIQDGALVDGALEHVEAADHLERPIAFAVQDGFPAAVNAVVVRKFCGFFVPFLASFVFVQNFVDGWDENVVVQYAGEVFRLV